MATGPASNMSSSRTLRDRLRDTAATYRITPRVLRMVWESHRGATLALCVLTALLGPLPMLFLYCGKRIYDGVEIWMKGDEQGGWETLTVYVSLAFGTILIQTAIPRDLRRYVGTRMAHCKLA